MENAFKEEKGGRYLDSLVGSRIWLDMAEIKKEKGEKYLDPLVGSRPPTLQENLLSGISGMGFRIPNLLPISVNAIDNHAAN